jgi:DNA polymerase-3 subunit gamma/tau
MSYQVIARKWRPQTFSDLVGQQHVTETLGNAIKNNRVAHAYIFSGARGVGKTTAARILAKALNCAKGPTAEPCGECDSCKEIAAGSSLDVIEIDAASNRGIDQIRELREMVRYAPASSRSKVVILDEAHMLTGEASNALLKTLEEPPDRVIFVMATTEPENLADTIRSRSQHFHFRALTFAEITARLEEIGKRENLQIEAGALAVIARMAEGSLRDALSLLEQARAYCGDTIADKEVRELLGVVPEDALNELVGAIAEGSAERALGLVHSFQKEGRNLQHFCREAIRHMRNLLMARVCGADSELIAATADQRPALAKAAERFSEEDLTRFFQILLQTDDDLRRKPDPRVHLEMGLLRLIHAARLAPLEELMAELKSGAGGGGVSAAGARSAVASSLPAPVRKEFSAGAPVATAAAMVAPAPRTAMQSFARPAVAAAAMARPSQAEACATETKRSQAEACATEETKTANVSARWEASAVAAKSDGAAASPAAMGAAAAAPAFVKKELLREEMAVAAEPGGVASGEGISAEQVNDIKTAIQAQQKFLGELLEQSSRWELDGSELRIYFPAEKRPFAEMIEGRESLEKVRGVSSKVLGRAVRVCAKLEAVAGTATPGAGKGAQELRARFERDPMVRSMLQRFGGKISEVRRRQEES